VRFLARRLANVLLLLLVVSFLSFALLQLTPGDFFDGLRLNPEISPQTIDGLRTQYRPFFAFCRALLLTPPRRLMQHQSSGSCATSDIETSSRLSSPPPSLSPIASWPPPKSICG
jgi:hypothetical protein